MKFLARLVALFAFLHVLAYMYVVQLLKNRKQYVDVDVNFASDVQNGSDLFEPDVLETERVGAKNSTRDKLADLLDPYTRCVDKSVRYFESSDRKSEANTKMQRLHVTEYSFFQTLAREFPHVRTCTLERPVDEVHEILERSYYHITTLNCGDIISSDHLTRYNASCTEDLTASLIPVPSKWREPSLRVWKYAGFLKDPRNILLTYVNIVPDAQVNKYGDVTSNNITLVPVRCDTEKYTPPQAVPSTTVVHRRVFSLHLLYGLDLIHNTLENLIRLAPYIQFLQDNPDILIHSPYSHPYLKLLGIDLKRLVFEPTTRASSLIVPAGTPCRTPTLFNIQLLQHQLRRGLSADPAARSQIVILTQTNLQEDSTYTMLHRKVLKFAQTAALSNNLTVVEFYDVGGMKMEAIREVFNRAFLVVSVYSTPELIHMFFSHPGTVLIEGICSNPKYHSSFGSFAQTLGLRHHSVVSKTGCAGLKSVVFTRAISFFVDNRAEIVGKREARILEQ